MRMWMVKPKQMCRKHLLGEHVETHMLLGSIKRGKNLKCFIDGGLVELHNVKTRHDALAKEILVRGYNHKSVMDVENIILPVAGKVDINKSVNDLCNRCKYCAEKLKV
jgi:hypothetical protein